ncbi:ABC transporter permease subunit [Saccharopolyspora sp. NPDC047091]|uniref:ABC transporter permease n=1 Tax=Saccharopolyspora sp. NPDC047091 TaxID=3155924 RepID=UPI0033F784FD
MTVREAPAAPATATAPAAGKRRHRTGFALLGGQLLLVAAVLAVLQWAVDSGRVKRIYLASPTEILGAYPALFTEQDLLGNLLLTLGEAAAGASLALVLGVATGVWMGLSRNAGTFLNPFVAALMAVPKVTIIPLLTLYLGIGAAHKIVIVFLFCYFLFVYNTIAGIKQVSADHLKVARSFGASRAQLIRKVVLPSATTSIVAAIKVETGTALVAALFAEITASKGGLGNLLNRAVGVYDTASVFALVLFTTVLSALIISGVGLLERKVLLRWKHS